MLEATVASLSTLAVTLLVPASNDWCSAVAWKQSRGFTKVPTRFCGLVQDVPCILLRQPYAHSLGNIAKCGKLCGSVNNSTASLGKEVQVGCDWWKLPSTAAPQGQELGHEPPVVYSYTWFAK